MICLILEYLNTKAQVDLLGQDVSVKDMEDMDGLNKVYSYGTGFFSAKSVSTDLPEKLESQNYDFVLVDGPPGIGCPVISATSGADLALIVSEPTAAGVHDMHRVLETTAHFDVPALVCINKSDVYPKGTAEIKAFCQAQDIQMVGEIPFDVSVTEAMVQGQPVTDFLPNAPSSQALVKIWDKVIKEMQLDGVQ